MKATSSTCHEIVQLSSLFCCSFTKQEVLNETKQRRKNYRNELNSRIIQPSPRLSLYPPTKASDEKKSQRMAGFVT
jgi:hypothetical protein